jgi:hypothetical protein
MDFSEVLSRAWQIIWKHKVLWIFGILAGCANGGGSSNVSYQTEAPQEVERFFYNLQDWQMAAIVGIAILAVLLLIVLVIFLSTIGKVGLIRGTVQADQDEEASLAFGELFSGSMPYFWRVLLLNLLVGLGIGLAFAALIGFGLLGSILTLGLGLLCLIPLICVLVPVSWAVMVIVEQSSIAIVVEDLGIMDGLRRGWEVVQANAGVIVVMWLVLVLGISLIGGFFIGLPLVLVAMPALVGWIVEGQRATVGGLVVAGLCLVGYLPILIVLNGVLRSYIESAWTLTFLRLTAQPGGEIEGEPEPLPEAAA